MDRGLCVKCHNRKAVVDLANEVFGIQFVCDECYCVVRALEKMAVLKVLRKQRDVLDSEIEIVKSDVAMFVRDLKKGAEN